MRIDTYNQIAQMYSATAKANVKKMTNVGAVKDQLSISQAGRDFQIAKKAVSEASDIRDDKVAKLKQMVDSGNYKVNPSDFASKLLEKYNSN